MSENKYSVVIPMYNNSETIEATLESILKQTRYDLIDEIVIVDDGSIDNSSNVVRNFINRVGCDKIKLISKDNGGAASARNAGIHACVNNWVALLDADDSWDDKKIEIQNKVLNEHKAIRALGTNRIGEVIEKGVQIEHNLYRISPFQYCLKNWPCTPSLIFDKSVFGEQEYFDESLSHAEEGIFFLDLAYKTGLYYLKEPLVLCGNGKPAFGHSGLSGNIKKMHKGILKVMRLAFKKGYISFAEYLMVCIWEQIKYVRRKALVLFRK